MAFIKEYLIRLIGSVVIVAIPLGISALIGYIIGVDTETVFWWLVAIIMIAIVVIEGVLRLAERNEKNYKKDF